MTKAELEKENQALQEQVALLRGRLDDITADEMEKALGREPADSLLLRTFKRMIRERKDVAMMQAADPGNPNTAHANGGWFYLDELEAGFVELYYRARRKTLGLSAEG